MKTKIKRIFAWLGILPLSAILIGIGFDDALKHPPTLRDVALTIAVIAVVSAFFAGVFWLAFNGPFKNRS
jgi:hypothetical protein